MIRCFIPWRSEDPGTSLKASISALFRQPPTASRVLMTSRRLPQIAGKWSRVTTRTIHQIRIRRRKEAHLFGVWRGRFPLPDGQNAYGSHCSRGFRTRRYSLDRSTPDQPRQNQGELHGARRRFVPREDRLQAPEMGRGGELCGLSLKVALETSNRTSEVVEFGSTRHMESSMVLAEEPPPEFLNQACGPGRVPQQRYRDMAAFSHPGPFRPAADCAPVLPLGIGSSSARSLATFSFHRPLIDQRRMPGSGCSNLDQCSWVFRFMVKDGNGSR